MPATTAKRYVYQHAPSASVLRMNALPTSKNQHLFVFGQEGHKYHIFEKFFLTSNQ
jgi:hypothetical protein